MVCNTSCSSEWSREEDIAFENALAIYPENDVNRWEKIAADVPGKTLQEIKYHYEVLVYDINLIESGFVILPCYKLFPERSKNPAAGKKESKGSKYDHERRKGIPWTEEEHKLFIEGLHKYGQGNWRGISRNYVVTRTPTQVASHAQKYYLRLKSMNETKKRRRSSIHDITHVQNGEISAPQGPTIGQASDSPATSTQTAEIYAAPVIGQPMGGPIVYAIGTPVNPIEGPPVSAIGTPVNLPAPGHMSNLHPIEYSWTDDLCVWAGSGTVIPVEPRNLGPMPYPMQHPYTHS